MVSFKQFLSEGDLSPIPVTKKFRCLHGNYCGPGNRGGAPVDALDAVCQKHDVGYHYTKNPSHRLKHDHKLIKAVDEISKDKKHSLKLRVKAKMVGAYFKHKMKRYRDKLEPHLAAHYS